MFIFQTVSCLNAQEKIDLEEYFGSLINTEYGIQLWDVYHEEFNHTVNDLRDNYKSIDEALLTKKKVLYIEITGKDSLGLIRMYNKLSQDLIVSFEIENDSLTIDYPTDESRRRIKIPKMIFKEGYIEQVFSIIPLGNNSIRLSINFDSPKQSVHFWIDKEEGVDFMFTDGDYSKTIGTPKKLEN